MILSILATVAVLAAIAVIAAALVFAETTLVYIALGLGGLSVLLLLGALLQGRFGADRRDTARTDGLGKSSVPVAPAAVPGHTWESEELGRVPAPAREPVRDTPVQEPTARTRAEESQEDPEFEVPRWETPTVGDWPEPVEAATPPTHEEEDERLPGSEDLPDESAEQAPAFAYHIPERTSREDEPTEEAQTSAGATAAFPDDKGERSDDWSPEDVEASETAETAEPEPAAFAYRIPERSSGDESPDAFESDTISEAEESEAAGVEETSERIEKASEEVEDERSERSEGNEPDEPVDPVEAAEGDPDKTAAFTYRIPESVRPDAESDVASETPESIHTEPDVDEPTADSDDDTDTTSEQPDVEETSQAPEPDEDDPDQTAVLTRESAEPPSTSDDEDNAVAYAAIFDETSREDGAEKDTEGESENKERHKEKGSDVSDTN